LPQELSILVPVYNEVATVERLLRGVAAVRFPVTREIIAVDDGSTDGSPAVLERLASEGLIKFVSHRENQGKGAAVRTAVSLARGQILVVQDADLELDPADLPKLLEPILGGETEVCFGTRFGSAIPASTKRLPTYWANRVLNWISNRLNGLRITDFNTGYKMMTAEVMARLEIEENGFGMEPEITAKIARLGYRIIERPVRYRPRTVAAGKKIGLRDGFLYLKSMLRYRFVWSPAAPSEVIKSGAEIGRVLTTRSADAPMVFPSASVTPERSIGQPREHSEA
jgi:glycosyltransferase involved in cell wall biosynthesis